MINQQLAPATLPPGARVYAIGDIHGCLDQLQDMHERIAADLAARPVGDATVVHLGDYVDRGPDSAGVIGELLRPWRGEIPPRVIDLMGNHEEMMLTALAGGQDDPLAAVHWLQNGGAASLRSWGISPGDDPRLWHRELPPRHVAFLRGLTLTHRAGGYVFVHAGIRPGVRLERQSRQDLLWIRSPFLHSTEHFEAVVVHGHTPAGAPEVLAHRINVDTGAVLGGPLTCAVLEADRLFFLQA
jgi:serine/threonine protein phosphatase 1